MAWGTRQRSLQQELAIAVAKAVAVTGLLLAAHVSNAVVSDLHASIEGRTSLDPDAPAAVTGYRPSEVVSD